MAVVIAPVGIYLALPFRCHFRQRVRFELARCGWRELLTSVSPDRNLQN